MLTTDALLITLTETLSFQDNDSFPKKEKKILLSLSHQLKRDIFLTKKQANLLINILSSNKENLKIMNAEEVSLIENPLWSKDFREIIPTKRIYFSDLDFKYLIVESTHDKSFKDKINKLKKVVSGNTINISPTLYKILCNEFNLITVVDFFSKEDFIVSDDVKNLYKKITELVKNNSNYLDIHNPHNNKILSQVTDEIINESDKDLILLDRRIKYQYSFSSKKVENSLKFKIANRSKTNIWIDETNYTLEEILESFSSLNRFPCLFVFDKHDVVSSLRILNLLKNYSEKTFNDSIGIYFRVDNSLPVNKEFNEFIKNNNLNKKLTSETKIAGIASALLPKFLLNTNWYPLSVINFSPTFNGSKTSAFCQRVDLITHYSSHKPASEKHYDIL
jgi:hypothetical protein